MSRILFFNNGWYCGGMERSISIVASWLSQTNEVYIGYIEKSYENIFPIDNRVNLFQMAVNSKQVTDDIFRQVISLNIDIFVGNTGLIKEFLYLYERLVESDIKVVCCNHEYYFYPHNSDYHMDLIVKRNLLLSHVQVVSFPTSFSTSAYGLYNQNGIVLPNPLSFQPQESVGEVYDTHIVLAVGRWYDGIKRVDRLLKMFALVLQKVPIATLVIVGPFDNKAVIPTNGKESVEQLIGKLDIPKNQLVFTGQQEDVSEYYKQASVLALTSESEGFGMVIIEAAACAVPTVCFDIPGLEDIVHHGENGYIVDQDDLQGMANYVCSLLTDSQLLQTMRESTLEYSRNYSIEKIGAKWNELVATLMEDNSDRLYELIRKYKPSIQDPHRFMQIFAKENQLCIEKLIIQKEEIYKLKVIQFAVKKYFAKIWSSNFLLFKFIKFMGKKLIPKRYNTKFKKYLS